MKAASCETGTNAYLCSVLARSVRKRRRNLLIVRKECVPLQLKIEEIDNYNNNTFKV